MSLHSVGGTGEPEEETAEERAARLVALRRAVYEAAVAGLDAALAAEREAQAAFVALPQPAVSDEEYAQAMSNRMPVGPPEYVAAAREAERTHEVVDMAFGTLERAIGDGVAGGLWQAGDEVRSPYSFARTLRVVEVQHAEAEGLSTVTLTEDSGAVRMGRHSVMLDPETFVPVDDGAVPVHFETWWGRGLRVAGTIHPASRLMLDVEVAG